jgi:hypothetical protein
MEDRELLERAAKAAGMDGQWCEFHGMDVGQDAYGIGDPCVHRWGDKIWNPLTDDGDALRLAVTLGLAVEPYPFYADVKHSVIVKKRRRGDQMREMNPTEVVELYGEDPPAATRRAIVRAAASLATKE